ncbi:jacalin-related lectin 19 [Amborella trichopoda]|nr:jacalin-related lectin 19 [Amborella trichopoda]|eukprot:XP_006853911.2 jacalin-related lectin 19 [Amborella trichopoda]
MGEEERERTSRKTIKVGPWGGHGGSPWDDGSFNGVRQITLVYDRCIDSIRVEYDKNGKLVMAEKHGGDGGNRTAHIKFQYPEEFITGVSGHYSPMVHSGTPVIRSLKFATNRKTYGPYGVEEGTPFSFPMDGGHIVGFKGRSGWYLDAIGFRLSRLHSSSNLFDAIQRKIQKAWASHKRPTKASVV